MNASNFVVMKFGGTSVATLAGWQTVRDRIDACLAEGAVPVVVHSALSGVSNRLEEALTACLSDSHATHLARIRDQHVALGDAMGVDAAALLAEDFATLEKLTAGIALIGEVSPRQHARVVALGELMASRLGGAWLIAQGVDLKPIDTRDVLVSRGSGVDDAHDFLNAECDFAPDAAVRAHFDGAAAYLAPGFIARNNDGETVLLGRGGSDTTASYLAALTGASRIEIWTDVPGMYSADPRLVPDARLLKRLDYSEAQEIASTGARVLHPRSLRPAREYAIPLHVRSTRDPDAPGTLVSVEPGSTAPRLKAISARKGVTLVSMSTSGMWREAGFLARAFAVFADRQLSVDLISSSETSVTVSLDAPPAQLAGGGLERLVRDLGEFCDVRVSAGCAAISLVGRQVRAILHEVAPAFEVFKEYEIYLVSQAANDLNFTFVVDEKHSDRLVRRLHDLLIQTHTDDPVMGDAWAASQAPAPPPTVIPWWQNRRDELLALAPPDRPLFVYDRAALVAAATELQRLDAVARVLYSIKANDHPDVLRALAATGIRFECVSIHELKHLRATLPQLAASDILFTPNFAPRAEYEAALAEGVTLTVDNVYALASWPDVFRGHEILLRVDPGQGKGHHRYVQTAGKQSKFGIPLHEVEHAAALAARAGARIVGLHAHKGSGIVDGSTWAATARTLAQAATALGEVRVLNLGGGLGVPDTAGGKRLDLALLNRSLAEVGSGYDLWLEPGRFVVAEAGVILARATQRKDKDGVVYIGLNTGMNTLLRPALYGAHHEIVNLTRLDAPAVELVDVVGPICESADVLGIARMLPATKEDDVFLIGNAGAYGRVMSSRYNRRPPGDEILI